MSSKYQIRKQFDLNGAQYTYFPFEKVARQFPIERLPFSLKILLENLLRHADEAFVTDEDIEAVAGWDPHREPDTEIAFVPARVILQDFTGVPAIVDLATMRDAMKSLGGDPDRINPLSPAELVIDHSVMVDHYGAESSLSRNTDLEVSRNRERYEFLKWGQNSFDNLKVVPPGTGIVHQVNLEYLARGVFGADVNGELLAYPDTLVGTDSHTTMINGLGVLGWGVGGIEAEAAMLGQPISMLLPQVVGFRISGKMPEGATATDLVLTVTEMLRNHGVVGRFVEFFGPGLRNLTVADRATIANMAPEYGATCGLFHIDRETLNYMSLTGRDDQQVQLMEQYLKAMDLWHDEGDTDQAEYTAVLELDLGDVVPCIAGPKRPQDRIALSDAKNAFQRSLADVIRTRNTVESDVEGFEAEGGDTAVGHIAQTGAVQVTYNDRTFTLEDGAVVIAAITSCTNTSNPEVLITAGLLAKKALEKGLSTKPWVKTSLAPGSKVVTDYLEKAQLMPALEQLGFYLVGYGCTTCIGNSGPLPEPIEQGIRKAGLVATSVLSGNRNFEGRIHPQVRNNYLASPPLVVAYALAGNMGLDLTTEPLGDDRDGNPVYLRDIWPAPSDVRELITKHIDAKIFKSKYADVYTGPESWRQLEVSGGQLYDWPDSTYIKKAPFFDGMDKAVPDVLAIKGARCLVKVGDSITTDHISPAGAIDIHSPAGEYLKHHGVAPLDFNSYGSRRGNHEVMMRGTFANIRLKNQLAPGTEGSWTTHHPTGDVVSIFEAAERYRAEQTPLVVLAGKEYGTGSSRDWAAKGPALLGVKVVIAESYERIHRSNLVGMGILPLQFEAGDSAASLGLDGEEHFTIAAIDEGQKQAHVVAEREDGSTISFDTRVRIDTPNEYAYYKNGGILHYVLRRLATS
ncbi:MAG: aconitate hydratase AcnA [Porticoccaceae bacterium]|nr:aconitate hydratase AcnA [Porticoccaceae bacterium]